MARRKDLGQARARRGLDLSRDSSPVSARGLRNASPEEFRSATSADGRAIRILLGEGTPPDVRLARELLRETKGRNDLLVAPTAEQAEATVGLTLLQKTVDRMGGDIEVDPEKEGGAGVRAAEGDDDECGEELGERGGNGS